MESNFDQELRKAFQDLQAKMYETTQRMKIADGQIEQYKRTIQHHKLTGMELSKLPTETKTYEAVGRMFMLQPLPDILKQINDKSKVAEKKIKDIETNKEYLQRSVKDHEDNIREMLAQRHNK